jgi:quinol monooxygenase YgiN
MLFKVSSYRVPAPERDRFSEALADLIRESSKEPGVQGYRGGFDLHDSEIFTITGIYENDEAFDAHLQSPHFQKAQRAVTQLIDQRNVKFLSAGSIPFTEEEHNTEAHVRGLVAS